jgi:hypothetical protein
MSHLSKHSYHGNSVLRYFQVLGAFETPFETPTEPVNPRRLLQQNPSVNVDLHRQPESSSAVL